MKMKLALSAAIFLVFASTAYGAVIVQHSGSTDPGTEGFVNNGGDLPVYGTAVTNAWNVSGILLSHIQ